MNVSLSHLDELRALGYTVVENVMSASAIARFKTALTERRARHHAEEARYDGQFWIMDALAWSPDIARAVVNATALELCRAYLETEHIHFCHQPVVTTVKPANALKGTTPEGGWHNDYPYHPGVFPNDHWPVHPVFGVQFNICIDEFRADNAATQFVLGSHLECARPPEAFNVGGTRPGIGVFKDVRQFEAPAGAAVIYDSRTWHRACHELNVCGEDRVAILNAVAPSWVPPMIDKAPIEEAYEASGIAEELEPRERDEIARLCSSPTAKRPEGAPQLRFKPRVLS